MREQVLEYEWSYLFYGGGLFLVIHILIFRLVSPVLSKRFCKGYTTLTRDERDEWNDRMMSNVNAVLSIGLSGYCLLYNHGLHEDKVWYDSKEARLACSLVIGYMVADVVCMVLWCNLNRDVLIGYLFHHAATIYAYYYIAVYGILCYFAMLRLIAEVSTPPVNQRWIFDILKFPRTKKTVILNGFIMLLTFFLFRMITMPVYWYQIWLVSGTDDTLKLGYIQLIMYIPCFVLDALNIFWFSKMCKGFLKALKGLMNSTNNDKEKQL